MAAPCEIVENVWRAAQEVVLICSCIRKCNNDIAICPTASQSIIAASAFGSRLRMHQK